MPLKLLLNDRIKFISQLDASLTFKIDRKKDAIFHTNSSELCHALKHYISIQENSILDKKYNLTENEKIRGKQFIENLEKNNLIDYCIDFKENESVIISPKNSKFNKLNLENFYEFYNSRFSLSRFAYFFKEKDCVVLDSPLAQVRFLMSDSFFTKLFIFFIGKTNFEDIRKSFIENVQEIDLLFMIMLNNNIIHTEQYKEPKNLSTWEFHDLIFHSKSRLDQSYNHQFGTTYRFNDTPILPPSTFKEYEFGKIIRLDKPDIDKTSLNNISLSSSIENRRSIRSYCDTKPISLTELSTLLYKSIGIRKIVRGHVQDEVFCPYPSAGALHEIECYLVINLCNGLASDIYHYRPFEHALNKLNASKDNIQKIITYAKAAIGKKNSKEEIPQILLIFTSCFQRIAWKYEKIAYRSSLISTGTIMQTISLVATAMNLGTCIIGSTSDLLTEAIGLDPLNEGPIGEMLIGSRRLQELN